MVNSHHELSDTPPARAREAGDGFEIAVGGAGLAGSLMALVLSRTLGNDCRIVLIDPSTRFGASENDPRAFAMSAASRGLLSVIGIWDDIAGDAEPIREIKLSDTPLSSAVRPALMTYDNAVIDPATGVPADASFIVANTVLAQAVQSALMSDRRICRVVAAIENFTSGDDGLAIATTSGPVTASLLLAADGSRSRLRSLAGIRAIETPHRQSAIVSVVAHDGSHDGVAVQHFLPSGPFAMLPMTGNRTCITWTEATREAERIVALDDAAFLDELVNRFGHQLGELRLAGGRVSHPLTTRIARSMTARRFALIGDAAHCVHPIAGQGLNLAIRDVAAMAECITDAMRVGLDPADASVLERYARWRRFDSVTSAAAFSGLNSLFSNDVTLLRSAREFGLGLVDRLPGLKRMLVTEAAGLSGAVPKLLRGEAL